MWGRLKTPSRWVKTQDARDGGGRRRAQKPPVSCFDTMGGRGWSEIPSVASKHEMGGCDA